MYNEFCDPRLLKNILVTNKSTGAGANPSKKQHIYQLTTYRLFLSQNAIIIIQGFKTD